MFINSVVDFGSTGKIVRDLANGLKLQGHEVLIIFGRHEAKANVDTFNVSDKFQSLIHLTMTRYFGRHGLHSNKASQSIINKIIEFEPDVIHLHNLHGYFMNVPMLLDFLKDKDIKILWTLHDAWLISGSSAYFDFNGCKKWEQGCVECNSTLDYPKVTGIKRQDKNFAWKKSKLSKLKNLTFITPSYWLKDMLSQTFLDRFPCEVVHNGIDLNVFKPTSNEALNSKYKNKKIVLGVSNKWEPRKGLNDFIELSKILSEAYVIVLIGLTEKEILALPEGIVGISRTSDANELAAYYSLAHALVNPTYEDNYPTTNLEALACGTRVIAYDTGGNKEVPGIEIVKQGNVKGISDLLNVSRKYQADVSVFSKEIFLENMMPFYEINGDK